MLIMACYWLKFLANTIRYTTNTWITYYNQILRWIVNLQESELQGMRRSDKLEPRRNNSGVIVYGTESFLLQLCFVFWNTLIYFYAHTFTSLTCEYQNITSFFLHEQMRNSAQFWNFKLLVFLWTLWVLYTQAVEFNTRTEKGRWNVHTNISGRKGFWRY